MKPDLEYEDCIVNTSNCLFPHASVTNSGSLLACIKREKCNEIRLRIGSFLIFVRDSYTLFILVYYYILYVIDN